MKAKDFIIIGGAVALFLLWQKNKTKKLSTSTAEATTKEDVSTTSGGLTSGVGTSQVSTFPTPTITEPQQVFGLGLPIGMDLPVLTAGTGVPTEVAVQQGGVSTTPTPAIVQVPTISTEESLSLGGVRPVVRVKPTLLDADNQIL
jgi:hypothetical protein